MSSHKEPSSQQLQPMIEQGRHYWAFFTRAVTIGAVSVAGLLVLMYLFLTKH